MKYVQTKGSHRTPAAAQRRFLKMFILTEIFLLFLVTDAVMARACDPDRVLIEGFLIGELQHYQGPWPAYDDKGYCIATDCSNCTMMNHHGILSSTRCEVKDCPAKPSEHGRKVNIKGRMFKTMHPVPKECMMGEEVLVSAWCDEGKICCPVPCDVRIGHYVGRVKECVPHPAVLKHEVAWVKMRGRQQSINCALTVFDNGCWDWRDYLTLTTLVCLVILSITAGALTFKWQCSRREAMRLNDSSAEEKELKKIELSRISR